MAELQATTSIFAPSATRISASSCAKLAQLVERAVAVREARGVPQVEEVLVRDLHEAFVQHGQPADAGVEERDGSMSVRGATA